MTAPQPLLRVDTIRVSAGEGNEVEPNAISAELEGHWSAEQYGQIQKRILQYTVPENGVINIQFVGSENKNKVVAEFRNPQALLDGLTELVEHLGFDVPVRVIESALNKARGIEERQIHERAKRDEMLNRRQRNTVPIDRKR